MTLTRRTSPFGELVSFRQAMDHLLEDSFLRPRSSDPSQEMGMPLDVYTNADTLVIEAALPGVKPEAVDISVLGDTLTITASNDAERRSEQGGYLYREVRRGSFSRSVTLPQNIKAEGTTATFENGLLRLVIPKAEAAKARQIPISPTTEGTATASITTDSSGSGSSSGGEAAGANADTSATGGTR